jgi:hypothetical protein
MTDDAHERRVRLASVHISANGDKSGNLDPRIKVGRNDLARPLQRMWDKVGYLPIGNAFLTQYSNLRTDDPRRR